MQVLATLFTEVFDVVGIGLFGSEADTSAMLPRIANLALHEITGHLVGDFDPEDTLIVNGVFEAMLRVLIERWWSWILIVTTNAADSFIVILNIVDCGGHVV